MSLVAFLKKTITELRYISTRVIPNRVYFRSFSGISYSDNPRYISEALHNRYPDADIVWGFKNPEEKKNIVPKYVKCMDLNNRSAYLDMYFSSAVIIDNGQLPYFKKSPKQMLIQTWHGDRAFKKVLYDSSFLSDDFFTSESKDGFCDLAIAGSEYGKSQYRTAFRYNGEVLMCGTPRNDILVAADEDLANSIKENLKIPAYKKLLLYAPTLRRQDAAQKTAQQSNLDVARTLEVLNKTTGYEWICLMRAHPTICDLSGVEYGDNIINVSSYEDMAELLLISDMLITDYSSCAGDFALLNRPIILFQPDIKEYLEKDRDFYFDMADSPYYIADSQESLESIIESLNEDDVKENCRKILEFYGTNESGKAAEMVAKRIVEWIEKNK